MAGVTMVLGGEPEGEKGEKKPSRSGMSDEAKGAKAARIDALKAFDEAMKAGKYDEADDLWEEYRAACEEM